MNDSKSLLGILYALTYCVVTSTSLMLVCHLESTIPAALCAFLTFAIVTLAFNIFNITNMKKLYRFTLENPKSFLFLNTLSFFIWASVFFALKYINPILTITIYMAISPLCVLLFTNKARDLSFTGTKGLLSASLAALIVVCITLLSYHYRSDSSSISFLIGVTLSFIAGISGSVYSVYSKKTLNNKLSASQILSLRFYMLIVIFVVTDDLYTEIINIH